MAQHHAIVIGSGFGGAVAACRLAQAGFAVTVLERGRRYDGEIPGFPRGEPAEWLWSTSRGLFDIRAVSEVQVAEAAGYGGGSLIYANIHLRAPASVFDTSWPEGYSRAALDPYYDLVAYMLDLQPIDRSPHGVPPRTARMREVAAALGRSEHFFHPPLAINFAPEPGPNKFGVMQRGCTHCAECVMGCTRRAKNTLDLNYLAVAERLGATMLTECEVQRIEPRDGDALGYRVHYRDHREGIDKTSDAEQVFVCAGAINSTEILLRSRAAGALPQLSKQLGARYSGNGDLIAFAFDADPPLWPNEGPTITTALLYEGDGTAGDRGWFLVEEGGFPQALWPLVRFIKPLPAGLTRPEGEAAATSHTEIADGFRAAAEQMPPSRQFFDDSEMAGSVLFLAQGRDLANGRIELLANGALSLKWDVASNLQLYSLEERLLRDVSSRLKGSYRANPFWRFLRHPVTVHNLGGCPMGRSEADGVTDGLGEVFNYPNLFVMDGAILPGATGVNPAHTIAAVAERNIERVIRRTLADSSWEPPERRNVTAYPDPLTPISAAVSRTSEKPPRTPAVGMTFRETMTGWWARSGSPSNESPSTAPSAAAPRGFARCELRITIDDVARFLADPAHVGIVTGQVIVEGLTGSGGEEVRNGVWNLFVENGRRGEREMRYALPFYGSDGVLYALRGTKVFRPNPGLNLWAENTTLNFHIGRESDTSAPPIGRGVVRIGLARVLSLVGSMRALRAPNRGVARRTVLDFLGFYKDSLREASRVEIAG